MEENIRKCVCCRKELLIKDFEDTEKKEYKNCAECRRKLKEYYKNNKDKIIKKHKEHYSQNKEEILEKQRKYNKNNKEDIRKRKTKYREKNKERIKKHYKEYREQNKEKIKGKNQEYYKNNIEKIVEYREKYNTTPQGQAVLFNAHNKRQNYINEQHITTEEWLSVMWINDWKCFYCDISLTKKNRTIDHLIPLSKNGKHIVGNLLPCCNSCNSRKYNTDIIKWSRYNELPYQKQIIINTMLEELSF